MPHVNPPLTDAEICRKFGITRDHVGFGTARLLSDHRPDRNISEWPDLMCPHCGAEFRLVGEFVEAEWSEGDAIVCEICDRLFWVEYVDAEEQALTLITHPEEATNG